MSEALIQQYTAVCSSLAHAQERIAALEAKVLYQHAILTHLWDARQHKDYVGKNHSTTLGTGPRVTRRLQLLVKLPDDQWVKPSDVAHEHTTIDDLHALIAVGFAERERCNAGRPGRALYLYRRTRKGTAEVRKLPGLPYGSPGDPQGRGGLAAGAGELPASPNGEEVT